MKCNKCTKAATLHITEVLSEEQFEEVHLCEECAHKYLYEPQSNKPVGKADDKGRFKIKLKPGADPQELLHTAMSSARISRFEVMEPSLEHIFIDRISANRG